MSGKFTNRGNATIITLLLGVLYIGSIGVYSAWRAKADPAGRAALQAYEASQYNGARRGVNDMIRGVSLDDCPENSQRTSL